MIKKNACTHSMEHNSATKRNRLQMHQHSNVIKKHDSKWKCLRRDNHILYNSIFILVKENCSDRREIRHPEKDIERRLIAKELKWTFLVIDMPFHNFSSDYVATWLYAAAKSLQSCPTLCDPMDGSPPGSPVPGILQARTLEWVAISFSSAWKEKWKRSCLVISDS